METIHRQIAFHRLSDTQRQAKLIKNSEYEIAVQNLSTAFYQKKRTVGVTAEEEEKYRQGKVKLWNDYKTWAISQGLYEEVTPEEQLAMVENGLAEQVGKVNLIRAKLKKPLIEVKQKIVIEEL